MKLNAWLVIPAILLGAASAQAKTFQNSYVSFEVPDNWTCMQEGVAWTCTPQNTMDAKEAVIVVAAKVSGPEDNLSNFLNFLKQPKKIITKVGTPMPSQVQFAKETVIAGHKWIQAQHLGSEVQDYYTLYLATVKASLAILVNFSCEKDKYKKYNPIFDQAVKTLRITSNQQLLFPKNQKAQASEAIGIQVPSGTSEYAPAPEKAPARGIKFYLIWLTFGLGIGLLIYIFLTRDKKNSRTSSKSSRPRTK